MARSPICSASSEYSRSHPEDGAIDVLTSPELFQAVKDALARAGFSAAHAEITMRAENDVAVHGEQALSVAKLLEWLEDLDDVQNVYSNADLPAEAYK